MDEIRNSVLQEIEINKSIEILSFSTFFIYNFVSSYGGFFETHKQLELIYVAEGEHLVINNNNEYHLKKGQAFLHRPYSVHKDKTINNGSKVFIVSFTCVSSDIQMLFDKILDINKEEQFIINDVFDLAAKYLNISSSQTYYSGKNYINKKNIPLGVMQIIKNKLELFFIDLIHSISETGESELEAHEDELTNRIIKLLIEYKKEKFSLDVIADNLNYSKNYLCGHFKKYTGYTISEYFYFIKINEAKELLTKTNESISSISNQLSFANVQYFSLLFKKIVGVTPSVWRYYAKKNLCY